MTFRRRRPLSGPWIRIPTEPQRVWPVAFATDKAALEAEIRVVMTRSVSRFQAQALKTRNLLHGMTQREYMTHKLVPHFA
jgi:hypothetical protein